MSRVRLMTCKVLRCMGVDRRIASEGMARVIAAYQPDIVALQQRDVGRRRSRRTDQAAEYLRGEIDDEGIVFALDDRMPQ
jgi:endonuclease/exonuclease/phosphatase family metal-dependent hydrolase